MKTEDAVLLSIFVIFIVVMLYLSVRRSLKNKQTGVSGSLRVTSIGSGAEEPAGSFLLRHYFSPVTISLMAGSIGLSLLSSMGASADVLSPLFIAGPDGRWFSEILAGQIWRLVTPIFIHFGLMHLVFNMIWLWDIGLPTERRNGHLFMLCFVLLVGVSANLAQYLLTGYPFFGGMSGVVYGLLGYLWMQGKYNPNFGIALHNRTIAIMLGWFVLCWFGLLGPVANWAHSFGLGVGIAWGYLDAARARSTSRDRTIEQQGG